MINTQIICLFIILKILGIFAWNNNQLSKELAIYQLIN